MGDNGLCVHPGNPDSPYIWNDSATYIQPSSQCPGSHHRGDSHSPSSCCPSTAVNDRTLPTATAPAARTTSKQHGGQFTEPVHVQAQSAHGYVLFDRSWSGPSSRPCCHWQWSHDLPHPSSSTASDAFCGTAQQCSGHEWPNWPPGSAQSNHNPRQPEWSSNAKDNRHGKVWIHGSLVS